MHCRVAILQGRLLCEMLLNSLEALLLDATWREAALEDIDLMYVFFTGKKYLFLLKLNIQNIAFYSKYHIH